MTETISIIIPVFNEVRYIERCLDSVLKTDYPVRLLEILVVDGMSTDGTRKIVKQYARKHPQIRLLDNPDVYVPHALNLGIRRSRGEYIIRLDAHSLFPPDYFSVLVKAHKKISARNKSAQNVGARCVTEVLHNTPNGNAIKKVLSDPLGVGNSYFRTGVKQITAVDTVPFGCYRRDTFKKYGLFDQRLVRNQDIELNKRILRGGGTIYLLPDIVCTYFAPETYGRLWAKNFKNGLWNLLTAYYTGSLSSLSPRHFIPLLFLLSLVAPVVLWLATPYVLPVAGASLLAYLVVITVKGLRLKDNSASFIRIVLAFVITHISYGLGSLCGLFYGVPKCLFKKNPPMQTLS